MKRSEEKARQKRVENENNIRQTANQIEKVIRGLENYAASYDAAIDAAAMRNKMGQVKKLIRNKLAVVDLADYLKEVKESILFGAMTANAMSALSSLPKAIESCRDMISTVPQMGDLAKSIEKVFKDVQGVASTLPDLSEKISNAAAPWGTTGSRLDEDSDFEQNERCKAELAAAMERVKLGIAAGSDPIAKPVNPVNADDTGDIDYQKLIDDINKKK